jgi:hypothetical protein
VSKIPSAEFHRTPVSKQQFHNNFISN